MLTWRVGCKLDTRPSIRRCTRSCLSSMHLFSIYPASFLINSIKPRGNNFLGHIEIPRTDQEIMESFIPQETSAEVTSRWNTSKQHTLFSLKNVAILIKELLVSVHISNATKEITQSILPCSKLIFRPFMIRFQDSFSKVFIFVLKEFRVNYWFFINSFFCLFIYKNLIELIIKVHFSLLDKLSSLLHIHL